jgi:glycosyltransferase involved in cell wall biosynthesis
MNVLIVSSLTNQSGSAVRFWSICRELGKLGHQVCFIERAHASERSAPNVTYLRSPMVKSSLLLDIMLATGFNSVRSLLTRADVAFVLKPLPNSCLPALLKKLGGAKIILDIDDLDYEYYRDGLLKKIVKLFYQVFPRHFHKLTVHTEPLRRFILEELGCDEQDIVFLPQGIDYDSFESVERDFELLRTLGLDGHKVLVYVASLGITSNLEPTLAVVKDVIRQGKDVRLLVIGGGARLDEYRQMADDMGIGNEVVFTGYVPHPQVPKYMALGDIALNYLEDNEANRYRAPIKIREYLALGIPVVSNLIGDTHLFSDYVMAFGDLNEYRAQILRTLEDRDEARIEAGRAFIAQNYDWARIVPEFEKALRAIVDQPS